MTSLNWAERRKRDETIFGLWWLTAIIFGRSDMHGIIFGSSPCDEILFRQGSRMGWGERYAAVRNLAEV